jgi:uncharacterized repeat protein (TIGR03803 family)
MKKLQFGILIVGLAISTTCHAQNGLMVTTVAKFTNSSAPLRQLVQGNDSALYGCLGSGMGAIFRVTPSGTLTRLVSFNGPNGSNPQSPPILAPDGYFYGTTAQGGSNYNYGTVYRMDSNGVLKTLFSFDQTNGASPMMLALGNDGSFYGIAGSGGPNFTNVNHGDGTIFKITTNGDFTLLACFNGTNNGYAPECLIQTSEGNLYGCANGGVDDSHGDGTVFRMTPDGRLTNLFVFNGTNGLFPTFIMQASDGCLYGTTGEGGPPGASGGVVYKMTTNGNFTMLGSFNGTNGAGPFGLTEVTDGAFYGVTESAGITGAKNKGTLFQVTTNGNLTVLLSFGLAPALPANPIGPLTEASDGNYYGFSSGPNFGTVYSIRAIQAPVLQSAMQGGKISLSWNAWAGYSNKVMYETNLTGSNWNLLSTVMPQTNGPTSVSDSIGPDTQRFYQVILQLP